MKTVATIKMNDISGNSHSDKEKTEVVMDGKEVKEVRKVISGHAQARKPSLFYRFKSTFFADDIENVKQYALRDVIIPGIKHLFLDSLSMLILGESYSRGGKSKLGLSTTYSYNTVFKSKTEKRKRDDDSTPLTKSYREIVLDTRGDAEAVIDTLNELIDVYGQASLSDLYDCVGISGEFTDNNYGWVDLRRASVRRLPGGGYLVDLPKPYPLN